MKELLILLLLITSIRGNAEPRDNIPLGLSAFGMMSKNFQGKPCNRFLKMLKASKRPAISVLWGSFGNRTTCLKRFWHQSAARGVSHVTQFHLTNEARRAPRGHLVSRDFFPQLNIAQYNALLHHPNDKLVDRLNARIAKIRALIAPYESDGWFILSTGLEDNYTTKAYENIRDKISAAWPYSLARSSVSQRDYVPTDGVLYEQHGYDARPVTSRCVLNGDGQGVNFLTQPPGRSGESNDASLQEVKQWLKRGAERGCVILLWHGPWQRAESKPTSTLSRHFFVGAQDVPIVRKLFKQFYNHGD